MADDPVLDALLQLATGLYKMWFPHGIPSNIGGVPFLQTGGSPVVTVVGGGAPVVGATVGNNGSLSVTNGAWNETPTSWTYQWEREGSPIAGATSSTYAPVLADFGCIPDCQVTAHNAVGASLPARSNLAPPVISATAFYVSSSLGSDSNAGTSSGAPWKTLKHVGDYSSSTGFAAGTSILLNRGDKWDWSTDPLGPVIFFNSSGSAVGGAGTGPIIFDAYGSGANPVIDGSINGTPNGSGDWTLVSGNVYQSTAQFLPPTTSITFTLTDTSHPIQVNWNALTGNFSPINNQPCVFANTGGALPPPLAANTIYYVWGASGSISNISSTLNGGNVINPTSLTQSGTQLGGISGFPYFAANDVGNILWNFSALGGTAPAQVMTASFGTMTGGTNTNGNFIWYKPGDGIANLGTANGNWNFNTDNCRVQIVSTGGNPATAMSGLRLVFDSGFFVSQGAIHDISIQNLTIQNAGASNMVKTLGTNFIIRDCVFQWIGGGNIGGLSNILSRAGDMLDAEGSYSNMLIERNYCYQFYDDPVGPQLFTGIPHDNMTIRNNIFYKNDKPIELETSVGNMNGVYIYNNTSYPSTSWSANQRPNSGGAQWGFEVMPGSALSKLDMRNNVFAGVVLFGILLHPDLLFDFSDWATSRVIDYNLWKLLGAGNIMISAKTHVSDLTTTNINMGGSAGSWQVTYPQFESHGLIDTDPSFTSNINDFTPSASSPLRNAGANLFAVTGSAPNGVVWDFFKKQRPNGTFTIGAIQG